MSDGVVVMLTALDVEYEAVRRKVTNPRLRKHHRGTRFEVGCVGDSAHRVALGLVGKGNHAAAVLAERAIEEFSPTAVVFVGVAGALKDHVSLGDVVVATHVYAYHGGTSEDDGLKARPRVWEADHGASQIAHHVKRAERWRSNAPYGTTSEVHFGAIAAGEVVHYSRISREARWIQQHYNDAYAIEMEAAGVAQAGHLSGAPVAVVRGISDRADNEKSTCDADNWQERAADNAASFAVELAENLLEEEEEEETGVNRGKKLSAERGAVYNSASGLVGIQARNVHNSTVTISNTVSRATTSEDFVAQLKKLRELMEQERDAGRLDDELHRAAESELQVASDAMSSGTGEGKKRALLALKKVSGLISDISELAVKVAALISSVRGI
jgi:adenosylhomocysteine nucleosidase